MNIDGSKVLVTGGAKRVGRSIALKFAEKGAKVSITYRTSEKEANETLKIMRKSGASEAKIINIDLRDLDQIKQTIEEVKNDFNGLDILVNNAAIFYKTPLRDVDEDDWKTILNTNLKAPFFCSQKAIEAILETGEGKGIIINIADWSGERPYIDYLPYCISKAGIIALTKGLAKELAPSIRVNAVSPGPVAFPPDLSNEEKNEIIENTPLGKGSPEYIADTVTFLVENEFMTGSVIPVEGGRLIS